MSDPAKGGLALCLVQDNPHVGDIAGNAAKIRAARAEAAAEGADCVILTELFLLGYPPDDLVLDPHVVAACREEIARLAAETADGGPAVILGAPWPEANSRSGVANAVLLLDRGRIAHVQTKHHLPNYGVFDDQRIFAAGPLPAPVPFRGRVLGLLICEDMWFPDCALRLARAGAEVLIVINGSPFEDGKAHEREGHARDRVRETGLPLIYVNQIGGQDELVFDGASFALDRSGRRVLSLPAFAPARAMIRLDAGGLGQTGPLLPDLTREESLWRAMALGLADYVGKNRFPSVILGLSGGIDSALTAALAVDALGADRVRAVMLPSPYTAAISLEDAAAVARLLGIRLDEIGIEPGMQAAAAMLAPLFAGTESGIAEENIQSRLRGLTLMALSNKFGPMLLTTGNKSEMAVGYATLYGDMCGGFSVLKDVYKMDVFALSRWRNQGRPRGMLGPDGPVMPERVITRPPSAELRPDQKDEDSLPPYPVLDAILERLIEGRQALAAIVAETGFEAEVVARVARLLDRAEYKRRQAPPGVKLTRRAFGRERRWPITNAYPR